MSDFLLSRESWSMLEKESKPSFEELMRLHDELMPQPDSSLQYAGAWAAIYASQKDHPSADEAHTLAKEGFSGVAERPLVKLSDWTTEDIKVRAEFAGVLADPLRIPKVITPSEQRLATYRSLEGVLSKALIGSEAGSSDMLGALSEIAVATLCWRPYPQSLSQFNTVPAGPGKESRKEMSASTDLYAYHPTMRTNSKARANLQIKTVVRPVDQKEYDQKSIVLMGINEIVHTDESERLSGRQLAILLAKTILADMSDEPLTETQQETLFYTMADIYDRVAESVELKTDRFRAKAVRNSQKVTARP